MCLSENVFALVDLFDKAVAEGARLNTVKTRSQPYDETDTQTDGNPATIASLWSEGLMGPADQKLITTHFLRQFVPQKDSFLYQN